MNRPSQAKLLVFTGKGGVGKTSVAAAFGLKAATDGARVLLLEARSTKRIPMLFDVIVEGDGPQTLAPGLTWMHLTPQGALETYAMRVLKFRSVYRAVFEQRTVQKFLRALPALAEILLLGHLVDLIEKSEYDLYVFDAPSSGPGALLLQTPQSVLRTAPRGPLFDGAQWIQNALADPQRTSIHLVTIPEELPISETVEFYHLLRNTAGLSMGFSVLNRMLPEWLGPRERTFLKRASVAFSSDLQTLVGMISSRLQRQEKHKDRLLAGIDTPLVELLEVVDDSPPLVQQMAQAFVSFKRGSR